MVRVFNFRLFRPRFVVR